MKQSAIQICDASIHPGEVANLAMPLPERYSCSPIFMPIKVVHGAETGPCLLVFAGVKGNELNGLEIINRLVNMANPSEIKGTVIAVPVLNVYGLTHLTSTLPSGNSINDCFPGVENGNFGERIAYLFYRGNTKKG